jgi:pilus assembly protein CpaE
MAEKILIVDDDIETLRLVGLMLQRQGYQIVAANNGTQALAMARNEKPDLIVLDVMMPDMDGFQVTRQIRSESATSTIPILMFTAKSQVEDKVAGYEAGVDDYLTKPVHPAELVAKIKGLLTRSRNRGPVAAPAERGYLMGVVTPKGGLGCSSMALNMGLTFQQKTKAEVIVVEIRPGQGCWASELGLTSSDGLNNLLKMKPSEINQTTLEKELFRTTYNVRFLLASNRSKDVELSNSTATLETVISQLPQLASLVIVDIGTNFIPGYDRIINMCQELIILTEAQPNTAHRTRILVEELNEKGFGKSKYLSAVIMNRVRSDVQLSMAQVQEIIGMPVTIMIPPAPEQAYQAALHYQPLVTMQPDGLVSQQYSRLVDTIAEHMPKR